jgi:hypothetical protein
MFTNEKDYDINENDLIKRWPQLHEFLHNAAIKADSGSLFIIPHNVISNIDLIKPALLHIVTEFSKPNNIRYWLSSISRLEAEGSLDYIMQHLQDTYLNYLSRKLNHIEVNDLINLDRAIGSVTIRRDLKELLLHPPKKLPGGAFSLTLDKKTKREELIASVLANDIITAVSSLIYDAIIRPEHNVIGVDKAETMQKTKEYISDKVFNWELDY